MSAYNSGTTDLLLPIDLISLPYKIYIKDGRQLKGTLISIDDQSNILLTNTIETVKVPTYNKNLDYNSSVTIERELGLVSIPKYTILEVFVDKKEYSKAVKWRQRQSGNGVVV